MKQTTEVHLGYEVGTGEPVRIPLRHLVVTGQTQEAGKTTTLEALIHRAGVQALAFVTKRGEGSFTHGRTIPPYFQEQADWKFVAAILEASRSEKMRFERSWIIKASRGAKTLADVQRNVQRLMLAAKRGMDADIYLVLDAYLDEVVPQIAEVRWARSVELEQGLNVMDLTQLNSEMQHLVIRSSIEWVLYNAGHTVVVVPEAWKFIPQGRGTPVKLAAESYIRQAAAFGNYLWLDSQDIAGVDKLILKSVPVWVLGVQRESNEIKRTLAQIPAGIKKPKPEQIATLGLGQFYVCHGPHIIKTYVQPEWMSPVQAQSVAEGSSNPSDYISLKEGSVNEREAQQLRVDNRQLTEELQAALARIDDLEAQLAGRAVGKQGAKMPEERQVAAQSQDPRPPHQPVLARAASSAVPAFPSDDEQFYQSMLRRLREEAPAILQVLALKPELEVEVRRETVAADGGSWLGRVALLIKTGFFNNPRKSAEVYREAVRLGATGVAPRADEACKKLLAMGFLTREPEGFLVVPEMKVRIIQGNGR